jgi:hypothetical protein
MHPVLRARVGIAGVVTRHRLPWQRLVVILSHDHHAMVNRCV